MWYYHHSTTFRFHVYKATPLIWLKRSQYSPGADDIQSVNSHVTCKRTEMAAFSSLPYWYKQYPNIKDEFLSPSPLPLILLVPSPEEELIWYLGLS